MNTNTKTIEWKHEPLFTDDAGLLWYFADDGGIAFVAPLAAVLRAHVVEPAVGPHPFADVTEVRGVDRRPAMAPASIAVAAGPTPQDGEALDVGLVVGEWLQFCDSAFEAVDGEDDAEEGGDVVIASRGLADPNARRDRVRGSVLRTWAYDDSEKVEQVLAADKREQLDVELDGLDSRTLARILATTRTLRSVRMLSAN